MNDLLTRLRADAGTLTFHRLAQDRDAANPMGAHTRPAQNPRWC